MFLISPSSLFLRFYISYVLFPLSLSPSHIWKINRCLLFLYFFLPLFSFLYYYFSFLRYTRFACFLFCPFPKCRGKRRLGLLGGFSFGGVFRLFRWKISVSRILLSPMLPGTIGWIWKIFTFSWRIWWNWRFWYFLRLEIIEDFRGKGWGWKRNVCKKCKNRIEDGHKMYSKISEGRNLKIDFST